MNSPTKEVVHTKELFQNLLRLQELEFSEARDGSAEAAISKLRRKIPLPILEHYDRLTARGKTGMAAVRHQVCMGCHMRIPIGAVITLMHGDDIQMCDNCGRYLYMAPEDPVKPEAVSAALVEKPHSQKVRKPRQPRVKQVAVAS
jgi:predicted  nucleic acid-binding Zn-ribbon protein